LFFSNPDDRRDRVIKSKKNNNRSKKGEFGKDNGKCPKCGAPIRAGYDTREGKIIVCENFPNCNYILIIGRKPKGKK